MARKPAFFFLPVTTATELVSAEKCSEMDILLGLWISAVYRDEQVQGSFDGPVAYLRNGTGCPLVSYSELAQRWGLSKATVGRVLRKLEKAGHISTFTFPGRHGTAIYLQNYLSTMFQISDVMVDNTTFTVKYANGEMIGRYTTGVDGTVTVDGLLPGSTVVVTEYKVPGTHVLNTTPQTITLKSGSNIVTSGVVSGSTGTTGTGSNDLLFEDDPKMTLTVKKFIKGTNYEPLAGVCFKITEGSGTPVGPGDGLYYTSSTGEIVVDGLESGTTVTVREVSTVEGFVLDGEPKTIKIKAGEKAPELIFWNEKAGSLVIQKKSSLDGSPLAGVQFLLTYADGSYVDYDNGHMSSKGLYETDSSGEIRITGVVGTVIAKELKTLPGFTIDPATQTQTVQINPADTQYLTFYNTPVGNFELIKVVEGNESKRIPKTVYVQPGKTIEIEWENTPITGQFQIRKYAAEYNEVTGTPAGTPLQGAVYEISEARSGKVVDQCLVICLRPIINERIVSYDPFSVIPPPALGNTAPPKSRTRRKSPWRI